MGSELGIGYDSERHAGYVDHWVQIFTDTPKEILYAAADAERISDYILTIEQKKEIRHTQEVGVMRKDIPHAEYYDAPDVDLEYFGDGRTFVISKNDPRTGKYAINFGVVGLTKVGRELAGIAGAEPVEGFFDFLEAEWAKEGISRQLKPPGNAD